jgi:hypothetical protein
MFQPGDVRDDGALARIQPARTGICAPFRVMTHTQRRGSLSKTARVHATRSAHHRSDRMIFPAHSARYVLPACKTGSNVERGDRRRSEGATLYTGSATRLRIRCIRATNASAINWVSEIATPLRGVGRALPRAPRHREATANERRPPARISHQEAEGRTTVGPRRVQPLRECAATERSTNQNDGGSFGWSRT